MELFIFEELFCPKGGFWPQPFGTAGRGIHVTAWNQNKGFRGWGRGGGDPF